MARKVSSITSGDSTYDALSQTPPNYDTENFFIKELQDKVDAEWPYRANRVDVEVETEIGSLKWDPLQVIVQPVKSDKNQAISNDYRRLVFKNIREDRFNVGHKFRFSSNYNPDADIKQKNTWLVVNFNQIKLTNTVIIQRCNGTLGSTYIDEKGVTQYHYEPVIQGGDLSAVNFFYNETLVSPQSQLLITAQHNEFTRKYFINQRFIIGYDKIYKLKAINKFYANSTEDPEDVGLIRMYLEITEDTSEYDDFDNRIAYQGDANEVHIKSRGGSYSLYFIDPEIIPTSLSEEGVTYRPALKNGEDIITPSFTVTWDLTNWPASVDASKKDLYVSMVDNGDGTFTFEKLRDYSRGQLEITWSAKNPDGTDNVTTFGLGMM